MFKAAAASRVAAFRMEFAGMAPAHSDAWVCHHRMLHSHIFQGPGECLLQEGSWGRSKSKNPVCLSAMVWRQPMCLHKRVPQGRPYWVL